MASQQSNSSINWHKWVGLPLVSLVLITLAYFSTQKQLVFTPKLFFMADRRPSSIKDSCSGPDMNITQTISSMGVSVPGLVKFLHFAQPLSLILVDKRTLTCMNKTKTKCIPMDSSHKNLSFIVPQMYWRCLSKKLQLNESSKFAVTAKEDNHIMFSSSEQHSLSFIISSYKEKGDHWIIPEWPEMKVPAYAVLTPNINYMRIDSEIGFFIAENLDTFLWQLEHSRLLTCRQDLATKLRSEYPEYYKTQYLPRNVTDYLADFRDIVYGIGIRTMLFGGTLLGWYRECGLIPYTTDLDMAALSEEYSKKVENVWRWNKKFTIYWILGKPSDSLEMSVYGGNNKIDLFFLYKEKNGTWAGGMYVPERTKLRWVYPKLEGMCTGELYNHLFIVPCNVEAFLRADYGQEWYIPHHDSNFTWYSSHHNVQKHGKWSRREWRSVYRTRLY